MSEQVMELMAQGVEGWSSLFTGEPLQHLETALLPDFLAKQRWFGGKSRTISSTSVLDWGTFENGRSALVLLGVHYLDGGSDTYLLPLGMFAEASAVELQAKFPTAIIGAAPLASGAGVLSDALFNEGARLALLDLIADAATISLRNGVVCGVPSSVLRSLRGDDMQPRARLSSAEQSNSSIFFGDKLIMKLFRKQQAGTNPDTEIGRYLTEDTNFLNIAPFGGSIEYVSGDGASAKSFTLAMLQGLVANQGDGWQWTQGQLALFYSAAGEFPAGDAVTTGNVPEVVQELVATYIEAAGTLGRRTGELHLALGQVSGNEDFSPEPFGTDDGKQFRARLIANATRAFETLTTTLSGLPAETARVAEVVLKRQRELLDRVDALTGRESGGMRIRVHGDYHLGQVLRTGSDFVILDFEGEPSRSLAERRAKQSPLKDVAGMLRSFSYAAFDGLTRFASKSSQDAANVEPWARWWERTVQSEFLSAYRRTVGESPIVPATAEDFQALLDAYVLDKALYELDYELNNRPGWVGIPLHGILELMRAA